MNIKLEILSADKQPNDRFGYSCYALVIPASHTLIEQVNELRQAAEMTRAAIPAHVTVKGTFIGISNLAEVKQRVEEITVQTQSFFIDFDGAESFWWEGGGFLSIPISPRLQTLHDALIETITPLGTTVYPDDPYRAHMTYMQDVSAEGLQRVQEMVDAMDFGSGFQAKCVDLWARSGMAQAGTCQRIGQFPLVG